MTARSEVVELLQGLPDLPSAIRVKSYASSLPNLKGSVVMVRVDRVGRGVVQGTRVYGMTLMLVTGKTAPGPADDELDDALEDVLHALDTGDLPNSVIVGDATRAVFEDSFPAYAIALTVHTKKETTP